MIVFVESNFVLELAFLREENEACTELLDMAEAQEITLVLPAFSVGEPYEALVRRSKQRRDLHNRLSIEIRELARSQPYKDSPKEFQEVTGLLLKSGEEEKRRLDEALDSILSVAEIIPIDANIIRVARTFQHSYSLSPQDSIVFASVMQYLAAAPRSTSCFLTTNSRDFVNPDIENELATYNCRLLTKFSDGLGYIRSHQ